MPSFDIVSEVDKQELDNAVNQARKELATRFDFKGITAVILPEKDKIILTASYDWWEHGTFSVHAEIAQGKAWAFLPSVSAFHLVAETAHGTLTNDFDNLAVERTASAAAAKIDMLVNGGGQAAIKMRAADGDIKIVEANP